MSAYVSVCVFRIHFCACTLRTYIIYSQKYIDIHMAMFICRISIIYFQILFIVLCLYNYTRRNYLYAATDVQTSIVHLIILLKSARIIRVGKLFITMQLCINSSTRLCKYHRYLDTCKLQHVKVSLCFCINIYIYISMSIGMNVSRYVFGPFCMCT